MTWRLETWNRLKGIFQMSDTERGGFAGLVPVLVAKGGSTFDS